MKTKREQVIVAGLCGDGYISDRDRKPFFGMTHSVKQKEYLVWKSTFFDKGTFNIYIGDNLCVFKTRVSNEFKKYANMFYNDIVGRKKFNRCSFDYMSPLFLAIWYLDDGSYNYTHRRCYIHSFMYDKVSLDVIADYLLREYGFDVRVIKASKLKNGQTYSLCFTVDSTDKFLRLIRSYVPKCMYYKLGHLKRCNISKIKTFHKKYLSYLDDNRSEHNRKCREVRRLNHKISDCFSGGV